MKTNRLTWEKLVKAEPRLKSLAAEAALLSDSRGARNHLFNEVQSLKLKSDAAAGVAYRHLCKLLEGTNEAQAASLPSRLETVIVPSGMLRT